MYTGGMRRNWYARFPPPPNHRHTCQPEQTHHARNANRRHARHHAAHAGHDLLLLHRLNLLLKLHRLELDLLPSCRPRSGLSGSCGNTAVRLLLTTSPRTRNTRAGATNDDGRRGREAVEAEPAVDELRVLEEGRGRVGGARIGGATAIVGAGIRESGDGADKAVTPLLLILKQRAERDTLRRGRERRLGLGRLLLSRLRLLLLRRGRGGTGLHSDALFGVKGGLGNECLWGFAGERSLWLRAAG
jgi:hypothetical protein